MATTAPRKPTTPKAAAKPARTRVPRVRKPAVPTSVATETVAPKSVAATKPKVVKATAAKQIKPPRVPRVPWRTRLIGTLRKITLQSGARFGAVLVTITTMAILYYGLFGLAREVGYHTWQAALFAFPIDGLVLVAYLAAYALSSRTGRTYAWGIVIGAVPSR